MFARLTLGPDFASDVRMSAEQIQRGIPHRPPMLLVDKILSSDETSIVCEKTFRADEFFVQGHFPGQPIVPGVIQCECCMQAGALLIATAADDSPASHQAEHQAEHQGNFLPVATRMDAVKFKRMVRPGDTVQIQVTLNDRVSNAFYLTGKMMLNGKLAARLDFACSLTDPQSTEAA